MSYLHKHHHRYEKEFIQEDYDLAERIYNEFYYVEQWDFYEVQNPTLFKRYMFRIMKENKDEKVFSIYRLEEQSNKVRVMLTGINNIKK
jgi:hypothetical protein